MGPTLVPTPVEMVTTMTADGGANSTPAVINTAHFDGIAANNLTVDLEKKLVVIEAKTTPRRLA